MVSVNPVSTQQRKAPQDFQQRLADRAKTPGTSRRDFLKTAAAGLAALTTLGSKTPVKADGWDTFYHHEPWYNYEVVGLVSQFDRHFGNEDGYLTKAEARQGSLAMYELLQQTPKGDPNRRWYENGFAISANIDRLLHGRLKFLKRVFSPGRENSDAWDYPVWAPGRGSDLNHFANRTAPTDQVNYKDATDR